MDARMSPWQSYNFFPGEHYKFDNIFDKREITKIPQETKESDAERKARLLWEQEKMEEKAQKKRLKKQRRKERKRQEKKEKEKENTQSDEEESLAVGDELRECEGARPEVVEEDAAEEVGTEVGSVGKSDSSNGMSCDVEVELDLTSCFVSKASQIVQRKLAEKAKKRKKKKEPVSKENLPKDSEKHFEEEVSAGKNASPDNIKTSTELAAHGNKCANAGDFESAVSYFTQAIKYNPKEFKLFGNRAFCLEKLQKYDKALADAELSLSLSPGWMKGLFRKGRALGGLKRYEEAVQAFREVLKQDSSCAEAAQEMMRAQIMQLTDYGFPQEQSSNALILHGTVPKARQALSSLNPHIKIPETVQNTSGLQTQEDYRLSFEPPRELFPVWVGNLTQAVTEQLLFDLFSKVGSLHSVKLLLDRRCAFVNFTQPDCCDEAIRRFHGLKLMGEWIAVRYPDRIPVGRGFSKLALKSRHPQ